MNRRASSRPAALKRGSRACSRAAPALAEQARIEPEPPELGGRELLPLALEAAHPQRRSLPAQLVVAERRERALGEERLECGILAMRSHRRLQRPALAAPLEPQRQIEAENRHRWQQRN